MTAPTHIAFSSFSYLLAAGFFQLPISTLYLSFCAFGSLLPDIDHPLSALGRSFFFISVPLERSFGHRTVTHSLLGLIIFALIFSPLYFYNATYFYILIFGILTHQILDQNNISGTEFFWPHRSRTVLPLNRNWRTTVGSKAEILIFILFSSSIIFLWGPSRVGYFQALRYLLGDFDSAKKEYIETCGDRRLYLSGKFKDNITLKEFSGSYEIIGSLESGLVILLNNEKKTVSLTNENAHIYPLKTRIEKGKKIKIITQRIYLKNLDMARLSKYIPQNYQYFLNGKLQVSRHENALFENYNPFTFSEGFLFVKYATLADIDKIKDIKCIDGYIDIQYRLSDGQRVPPIVARIEEEEKYKVFDYKKYLKYK